ncbi:hypothetical protein PVAP13_4NG181000 [Panicum virgatum]|uniref:Uncharacterized protein n=1 Tax=Panicum virgatum TaxID=38727 RepID=A0A8T0T8D4_PANVG|nr:hypothetical protein PVAP13_4NG181000 [Panicum virgatum]
MAPWILAPIVLLLPRALFSFPSVPALFFLPSRVFSPPELAQPSDSSYLTVKTLISSVDRQEQGCLECTDQEHGIAYVLEAVMSTWKECPASGTVQSPRPGPLHRRYRSPRK